MSDLSGRLASTGSSAGFDGTTSHYDLSVLKRIDTLDNPEIPQRILFLGLASAALALTLREPLFVLWYGVFLGTLTLHLALVARSAERVAPGRTRLIATTSAAVAVVYLFLGLLFWVRPEPYMQLLSLLLMLAAMLNTNFGRARDAILLRSDLIGLAVGVALRVAWLWWIAPASWDTVLVSLALLLCYAYYLRISLLVWRTHSALDAAKRREEEDRKYHSVGRLAAGFAHDFNNLLQAILGHVELSRLATSDAERDAHLSQAERSARHGADLTSRLLDLSRKATLQPGQVAPVEVLAELESRAMNFLPPRQTIQRETEPGLPPIMADRRKLLVVLENLLVNASQASPDDGTLRIAARRGPGETVIFTVSDTGPGISRDLLDLVFEPYFTTRPTGQGKGLGLSEAKGIIEQSGGYIRLTSEEGSGTTVTVGMPLA